MLGNFGILALAALSHSGDATRVAMWSFPGMNFRAGALAGFYVPA
ncbi:hypothetical protein VSR68_20280 [Paraburkholderia phymatum]